MKGTKYILSRSFVESHGREAINCPVALILPYHKKDLGFLLYIFSSALTLTSVLGHLTLFKLLMHHYPWYPRNKQCISQKNQSEETEIKLFNNTRFYFIFVFHLEIHVPRHDDCQQWAVYTCKHFKQFINRSNICEKISINKFFLFSYIYTFNCKLIF